MKKLCATYSLLLFLGSAGFMHGAEKKAAQELVEAARKNDLAMAQKLFNSGRVGVNDTDNGINALAAALQGQDNRFSRSQENWIAREPLIRDLLDRGAHITLGVLSLAATDPSTNTLRMILERAQLDVDLLDKAVTEFEKFAVMAFPPSLKMPIEQRRDRLLKVWLALQEERFLKLFTRRWNQLT